MIDKLHVSNLHNFMEKICLKRKFQNTIKVMSKEAKLKSIKKWM